MKKNYAIIGVHDTPLFVSEDNCRCAGQISSASGGSALPPREDKATSKSASKFHPRITTNMSETLFVSETSCSVALAYVK